MSEPRSDRPVALVVEDEGLARLLAVDVLDEAGFEVLDAADAEAALLQMAMRPDVRLMFTDIQMPGTLDGMELARRVHERWPHVLLLITSGACAPARSEIADHGRFLAKPYSATQLLHEILRLGQEADERRRGGQSS